MTLANLFNFSQLRFSLLKNGDDDDDNVDDTYLIVWLTGLDEGILIKCLAHNNFSVSVRYFYD